MVGLNVMVLNLAAGEVCIDVTFIYYIYQINNGYNKLTNILTNA